MASDPDIIGKSVTIDGVPHTVVGIAPADFRGHFHFFQAPGSLLFVPLERHPRLQGESESSRRQDGGLGANPRPARPRRRHHAGERAGVGDGLWSGAAISRIERIQGGHRRAVHLAGCGRPSGVAARDQRPPQPGGSGAPDRVPEHLGHDAGPRRQPRARAVHPRGARRGPAASHPASVLRSGVAGVCRRRAQRVRAVRYSCHRWMVDGRAGSSGDRSRRGRCRDLVWTVPAGERALRVVAGRSLQPSQSGSRAEGGCRRRGTPDDSRASCGGDGANRHRHTVSRDQRRDARPGADGRFRLSDRWTGGRASAGASRTGARGRLLHPEGSRQSPTGQRRSLCGCGRGHADRLRLPALSSRRARMERSSSRRTSRASAKIFSRPSARRCFEVERSRPKTASWRRRSR